MQILNLLYTFSLRPVELYTVFMDLSFPQTLITLLKNLIWQKNRKLAQILRVNWIKGGEGQTSIDAVFEKKQVQQLISFPMFGLRFPNPEARIWFRVGLVEVKIQNSGVQEPKKSRQILRTCTF